MQTTSRAMWATVTAGISPRNVFDFSFGMGFGAEMRRHRSQHLDIKHSALALAPQENATGTTGFIFQAAIYWGTLRFGYSPIRMTSKSNFNLTLGVGVTREAPDLELTVRYPTTFF